MFNALVHTYTRSFLFFFLFPPSFLFPVWTVLLCSWQTSTMNGRRKRQKERERERTIGRQIERRKASERKKANPLFVLFWHSSSPPMMYVRERDAVNVSHAHTLLLVWRQQRRERKKISSFVLNISMFISDRIITNV
jgi:hypothetical protein